MIKSIHLFLNQFTVLHDFLRFLAYLKNDFFNKNKFEDMLVRHMPKGWQKMKILDLGCGSCNVERKRRFRGVDITCVDVYEPYLQICKNYGLKTVRADLRNIKKYFPQKSADIIWLFDVVEHLKKNEALQLLNAVDKIARKQIIIFTPVGEFPQDEYDGNKYQKHRSSWTEKDLEKKGFTCTVLKNYHYDVRHCSKKLAHKKEAVAVDAMWAVKNIKLN